jgi:hypothetical protein
MKGFILSFLFLTGSLTAIGQFNDSTNYYVNFAGTGNINKTNDGTSYLMNNVLRFNIRKNNIEVNTTNSYIYGESNDNVKTNSDFFSIADVNFLKNKQKLYFWGLANYERSLSLKIDGRFQGGAGLGYNLIDRPGFKFLVTDGLLYESTRLREIDKYGRIRYETLRNSFRIKFRLNVKDLMILDGSDFLQNSLSDKNDYIIKSNTTLSFRLRKWLSLTTSANYNRLNLTGTENLLITYGLSMEKYF